VDRSLSDVGSVQIELSCYVAEFEGNDPVSSSDHDAMQWVPLTELSSLHWAPGDIPLLDDLPERLTSLRHESKAE
jgi:8-oxo-dGTP diphosphatase